MKLAGNRRKLKWRMMTVAISGSYSSSHGWANNLSRGPMREGCV